MKPRGDPLETYQKIVRGIGRIKFTYKDADAIDLVKNLCRNQPNERLPMRPKGSEKIKKASWYKSAIKWDKLEAGTAKAPFEPPLKSDKDPSNFRVNEANMPASPHYDDDGTGWDEKF